MNDIINIGTTAFLQDVSAAVVTTSATENMIAEANDPTTVGSYDIVPWGSDNTLPQEVISNIEKAEVVEANLFFNICVGYGQGLKPMLKVFDDNGDVSYKELPKDNKYKKVKDFFEDNDIEGYFLEQITDMHTFFNVFPEMILNNEPSPKIVSLRSKEAAFSRWGTIKKGETRVLRHYYSAKWGDDPSKDDIEETYVIDRFSPKLSLLELIDKYPKERRFIYHVNFPTPGRNYYQRPYWWAIFKSGWYDFLIQIPRIKKALLKNKLGLRYMVYIHPAYWDAKYKEANIDISDVKAKSEVQNKKLQEINDFISGEESTGKGMVTTKNYKAVANGVVEEKWIEFVRLPTVVEDGELIADSEEAANVVSYAMQVHSSLLGSTPGKSKGSFSGTDKRELFNIKASMMAPFINRIIKPLYFIKKWNKWPEDIVFVNPQIEFTTLDNSKTGQTTKTEE